MTADSADALRRVGSLWWYARLFRRHARVILAVSFGLAVAGAVLSFLRAREYTAIAKFRAVSATTNQSALGALGAQLGLSALTQAGDAPEFYIDVLRSRTLLKDLGSRIYTIPGPPPFSGDLYTFFEIPPDRTSARNIKLVDKLEKKITTSVERPTGIVTVEVNTTEPKLSEQICVTLLALLNQYDINRRREQARAEREFVEQRLSDERAALTAEEDALTSFFTRNRQLLIGRGGAPELIAEESRLQRRVQFRQELYLSLAQNLSRAELEESRNTPTVTVLERPEGFVERRPRGTLRLALLLFFFGLVVGFSVVVMREYLSLVRGSGLQRVDTSPESGSAARRRSRQASRAEQTAVAQSAE